VATILDASFECGTQFVWDNVWTMPLSLTSDGEGGMAIGLCDLRFARVSWDIEAAGRPVASSITPSMLVDGPL